MVSMKLVSAGGLSTTSVSEIASICLWKEDHFFCLRHMPDSFLLEIGLWKTMIKEKSDVNEASN